MILTEMGRTVEEAEFRRDTQNIVLDVALLKCPIDRQVGMLSGSLLYRSGSNR